MIRLPEHMQGLSGEDLKSAIIAERRKNVINLIMRQTEYSAEEAEQKLVEANNNYMKVIQDFLGIEKKTPNDDPGTVNQRIYGQIRGLMDTGASQYRAHQEKQQKAAEYKEKMMQAYAAQQEKLKKENAKKDLAPIEENDAEPEEIEIASNKN